MGGQCAIDEVVGLLDSSDDGDIARFRLALREDLEAAP
jgi:hypothetical protein